MEHFLRTARWLVSTGGYLQVGANCRVRQWSGPDAEAFREQVRKRNAFSRHAGPGDFYYQRATALMNATVLEIYDGGESTAQHLASRAALAEGLVLASFVLYGSRRDFYRKVAGGAGRHVDLHLIRRGPVSHLKSTSSRLRPATGLRVDARAISRYQKAGFEAVYDFASGATELAGRVRAAVGWLVQSRTDPSTESAVVKTSTALESLLVVGREPPTRALQERSAYLLTEDPGMRQRLAKAAQRFYELRGDVVHGKKSTKQADIDGALEFGDRLVVLSALVMAHKHWKNASELQEFCDRARWGHSQPFVRAGSKTHLRNMLARFDGA